MKLSPRLCAGVAAITLSGLLSACGDSRALPLVGAAGEAPDLDASAGWMAAADASQAATLPPECAGASVPPPSLACTGLYADLAAKSVAAGVEPYAPAVPLWSDGALKQRWISLPPGEQIDDTDPDEWIFPVGTKVWKEFTRDGRRVETRLWQKVTPTYWVDATYAWNAGETAATRSAGGDIPWGSGTYHIPTSDECQKCHRGRTDRILGFEQVLLGLDGATGLTLGRLAAAGRLKVAPPSVALAIGDDGTGAAAPALAWLHVNCGTTCHNRNSNATAWATGMFLRLSASQLDGRPADGFDALVTTVGVAAVSTAWKGQPRIARQDPDASLLYHLITNRGQGNQMPPIATAVVDPEGTARVGAWIRKLPAP
ncbi:MAG TPA: hypothetical protein VHM31_13100 [Polyangia bacterium]|nr:hypothetical protein [Polyangia bacterium]